jgi:hypothetical protein
MARLADEFKTSLTENDGDVVRKSDDSTQEK